MTGKCTIKQFVRFKSSLLPSEEPQTVCPHGLVTALGCRTHSAHARQGFLCLKEEKQLYSFWPQFEKTAHGRKVIVKTHSWADKQRQP